MFKTLGLISSDRARAADQGDARDGRDGDRDHEHLGQIRWGC
jgi:hypothetical protein